VTKSAPPGQVFYVGQEITSTTGNQYQVLVASPDSVVLKNTKAGKGHGLETPVSMHVVERLRDLGYSPGDLSLPGSKHKEKVAIADKVGVDMQTLFGMTGPLRAVWEYVEKVIPQTQERRPVVLVIDEINRADLSRVFGELITLLEPDKRLGASEERRIILPYSQTLFGVPSELHVIATMNTADKSLATMDAALRRRFEFVEVGPDPTRCASPYGDVDLPAVLRGWNQTIRTLGSKDVEIGHSYFERDALERIREQHDFDSTPDGQLKAIAMVIRRSILPLLADTFRSDWVLIDLILGENYSTATGGFIDQAVPLGLTERAGQVVDVSDSGSPSFARWANPLDEQWNPDTFRKMLALAAA
jgi:5-methylcytosine-specific restriction protein B